VTETATSTIDTERRLEAFRGVRETIEASILPLATSGERISEEGGADVPAAWAER
jgi:hypothetical protein